MSAIESVLEIRENILDRGFVILPGETNRFLEIESALVEALKPAPGLQRLIFEQILHAFWSLHRLRKAEVHLYRSQADPNMDPLLIPAYAATLARLQHAFRIAELALRSSVKHLAAIQTEVRYRLQVFPPEPGTPFHEQMPHSLSLACQTPDVLKGMLTRQNLRPTAPSVKLMSRDSLLPQLAKLARARLAQSAPDQSTAPEPASLHPPELQ